MLAGSPSGQSILAISRCQRVQPIEQDGADCLGEIDP